MFLPAALRIFHPFTGRTRAEQPFKNLARIGLGRQRCVGRTPGKIVLIGAGIAGIARAGVAAGVAGQFQRRKPRQVPDLARDGLVNRNPGVYVRGAFFHPHAGEKSSVGAGVIAAAVHAGHRIQMIQPADHLDLLLVRRQRL